MPTTTVVVVWTPFAPTTFTVPELPTVVPVVVTAVAGTYSALLASPVITLTLTDCPGLIPDVFPVSPSVTPYSTTLLLDVGVVSISATVPFS